MDLKEMQRLAEEAFLFANRLAVKRDTVLWDVDLVTERIISNHLKSIAASLMVIACRQEDLLEELRATRAIVSSIAANNG